MSPNSNAQPRSRCARVVALIGKDLRRGVDSDTRGRLIRLANELAGVAGDANDGLRIPARPIHGEAV